MNLLKDEISVNDIRNALKKLKKGNNHSALIVGLSIVGGIVVLIGIAIAVTKFLNRDNDFYDDDDWDMDFEEGSCDENGCYYSEESDFEE